MAFAMRMKLNSEIIKRILLKTYISMDGKMDLNSTYSLHITEDIIFQILIFWKCIWMAKKCRRKRLPLK